MRELRTHSPPKVQNNPWCSYRYPDQSHAPGDFSRFCIAIPSAQCQSSISGYLVRPGTFPSGLSFRNHAAGNGFATAAFRVDHGRRRERDRHLERYGIRVRGLHVRFSPNSKLQVGSCSFSFYVLDRNLSFISGKGRKRWKPPQNKRECCIHYRVCGCASVEWNSVSCWMCRQYKCGL